MEIIPYYYYSDKSWVHLDSIRDLLLWKPKSILSSERVAIHHEKSAFFFSFKHIIEVLYWCFTEVIVKYTNHNFFLCQQNAVRHTLSLRKRFVRVPDPKRPYKSMWTISSDYQRNHLKEKRSQLERKNPLKNKNVSDKESDQMAQSMDFETTSEFSGSCASPNQSQDGF